MLQFAAHGGDLHLEAEVDLFAGGDGAHPGDGDDVIRRSASGACGQVGQTLGCSQFSSGGGGEWGGATVGAARDVLGVGVDRGDQHAVGDCAADVGGGHVDVDVGALNHGVGAAGLLDRAVELVHRVPDLDGRHGVRLIQDFHVPAVLGQGVAGVAGAARSAETGCIRVAKHLADCVERAAEAEAIRAVVPWRFDSVRGCGRHHRAGIPLLGHPPRAGLADWATRDELRARIVTHAVVERRNCGAPSKAVLLRDHISPPIGIGVQEGDAVPHRERCIADLAVRDVLLPPSLL